MSVGQDPSWRFAERYREFACLYLKEISTMFVTRTRLPMFVIVIGYTIVVRLLPYFLHGAGIDLHAGYLAYMWNFSPVFALSLFGGPQLKDRRAALLLPLVQIQASKVDSL